MNDFCSQKGIKREFSNGKTLQQNGVAERRNRTLIEAARTMLADAKLPVTFLAEAVNIACYVQNRGRSINEGEAAAERISNDSEEVAMVLTSMDAATVLTRGIDVPTSSGSIPTTGLPATIISTGSEVSPTASPSVSRRKGKEVMVESDTPKKKKLQEQIDAQVAR
nr:putative ribonuclease H-like domain-containing protein [Tanacetum cinerariifolium]